MSLTAAMNNAASGLAATSKMAQTISTNTANALTEGYARREVNLSSSVGSGVKVDSISRVINDTVLKEKWLADASAGNATVKADFARRLENAIGDSETDGSLDSLLSDFETSLISAATQPESSASLTSVATAAAAIADKLNEVSDDIQTARQEADRSIATQVDTLNTTLSQIEDLNVAITRLTAQGGDANALLDERQSLIDKIAEIVPVSTVARSGNQIAIFTTGGQTLLDGSAATIGFTQSNTIVASSSIEAGTLSGLTINGRSVSTDDSGGMGGGTLGAAFAVRDILAPQAQQSLDAFARELIERFSDNSVDTTLQAADAGLFTDGGEAFDTANEAGLAGRIALNTLVDPSVGGEVWRLRDGLDAASEGDTANASILTAMQSALSASSGVTSGPLAGANLTIYSFASEILSLASSNRLSAEATESYTSARQESATEQFLSQGVDTDYELEQLQLVQQAYAANAKVVQAIDAMMQSILEI